MQAIESVPQDGFKSWSDRIWSLVRWVDGWVYGDTKAAEDGSIWLLLIFLNMTAENIYFCVPCNWNSKNFRKYFFKELLESFSQTHFVLNYC